MDDNLTLQNQRKKLHTEQGLLSDEEMLEVMHPNYLEEQQKEPALTPEEIRIKLLDDVTNDTKWYGDSDEMFMIKSEIADLREKWVNEKKVRPTDLLFRYDCIISMGEKYLSGKGKGRGMYADRHQKVRNLCDALKAEREELILTHVGIETEYGARRHDYAISKALNERGASRDAARLEKLLNTRIPDTETEFQKAKKKILDVYDDLIDHYKSASTSFCIFFDAKKKRLTAQRVLEQLEKERSMFKQKQFFEKRSLDQELQTKEKSDDSEKKQVQENQRFWGDDLTYAQMNKEIDDQFLKDNPNVKLINATEQENAYNLFSRLAGVRDLFIVAEKKVNYMDSVLGMDTDAYLSESKKGLTLEEALVEAKNLDLPLMYSDEALDQIQTIQIIDFILGQKGRDQNSFQVKTEIKNIENIDYLVITHVMATDHGDSLGKETADDLNKENQQKSTREIFDKDDKLLIPFYDYQAADKIIEMDENKLADYFRQAGVSEEKISACKGRLRKMQTLLKKDKEKGRRADVEADLANPEHQTEEFKNILLNYKRSTVGKNASHTYVLNSLIQDSGRTYWDAELRKGEKPSETSMKISDEISEVAQINKKSDHELRSEKPAYEKRKRIKEMLDTDEAGFAGQELQDESRKVLDAVKEYMSFEHSVQSLKADSDFDLKGADLMRKLEPGKHKELQEKAKSELKKSEKAENKKPDLDAAMLSEEAVLSEGEEAISEKQLTNKMNEIFYREEGDKYQYYFRLKSESRERALNLLIDRMSDLNKLQDRTAYQQAELERYAEYLEQLHSVNESGNLKYDIKKDKLVKVEDTEFSDEYHFISVKDQPLFPEDPKLTDLVQGGVGDCYLIAILGSVVENDPQFIKDHMKDNGDGTVTVKLYQPTNAKGTTFQSMAVTVEKSVPFQKAKPGKNAGAFGSLWVQMYEKALIASGITGRHDRKEKYSYSEICGGAGEYGLSWVLGTKGQVLYDIAEENHYEVPQWKYKDKKNQKTKYIPGFNQTVQAVKKALEELLKEDVIVTAGAFEEFKDATGKGGSGESVRRGVAGKHAYTVIKMEEINGKTYVRIRNPWGTTVSETAMNQLTGKTFYRGHKGGEAQGSFLMDINTFVEHIQRVTYIKKSNVKGKQDRNGAA